MHSNENTLRLVGITRRFDEKLALDGASATFRAGSVHGVLGENGAGKTTLMRIAAGLLRPDSGTMVVGGQPLETGSPPAAAQAGIAMVHQHFMLVPTLTVAENFVIGRPEFTSGWGQFLSRGRVARRIDELSRQSGLQVDPSARVDTLSVGERQRVEILRALCLARRVLILDEPTAVLTPQESEQLFASMRRLRAGGLALVFISHKLDEVAAICDEVTILRNGVRVHGGAAAELDQQRMAELMMGSSLGAMDVPAIPATARTSEPLLRVQDVSVIDQDSHRRIKGIDLAVHPGEVVGVAGVEGNGQDLLASVIVGVKRPATGRILVNGRDVTPLGVRERCRLGLAHVPEDRLAQALVPAMSLRENLILKDYAARPFSRAGFIAWKQVETHAGKELARCDVRGGASTDEARNLSGGNQQKLILARELSRKPSSGGGIIVAHNPVRGLDIAATQFVFGQLLQHKAAGAAILLIHSDLDELLQFSDRVVVMFRGECIDTAWPECDRATIGRMMLTGGSGITRARQVCPGE